MREVEKTEVMLPQGVTGNGCNDISEQLRKGPETRMGGKKVERVSSVFIGLVTFV